MSSAPTVIAPVRSSDTWVGGWSVGEPVQQRPVLGHDQLEQPQLLEPLREVLQFAAGHQQQLAAGVRQLY
jgi:hypothetical protein